MPPADVIEGGDDWSSEGCTDEGLQDIYTGQSTSATVVLRFGEMCEITGVSCPARARDL